MRESSKGYERRANKRRRTVCVRKWGETREIEHRKMGDSVMV